MAYNSFQSYVRKNPFVTASATVLLAASVAFVIRGGTGTTTYIDYKREVVTCTQTGGLAKYAYCNWQEPVDDSGSGSVITSIFYSVGKNGKVHGVDFTVGSSATVSGSYLVQNLQDVQTATGLSILYSTGAVLVGSGQYLRGVTLTAPNLQSTAGMMIEYYTRLSR